MEVNGSVIEDSSWLRRDKDSQHINIAELDAAIKGLTLATKWPVRRIVLCTDSKIVCGWLSQSLNNIRRLKVGGLQEVLVRRRIQIIEDIVDTCRLDIEVKWVATADNLADELTRVPSEWLPSRVSSVEVAASAVSEVPSLPMEDILHAQEHDEVLQDIKQRLVAGEDLAKDCSLIAVKNQLCLVDEMICRSVKLLPNSVAVVPIIPSSLQEKAVAAVHHRTGHAGWDTMWQVLREECFSGMAEACRKFVHGCSSCKGASPRSSESPHPTRPVSPGRPWEVVQMDTLELGTNRSGKYHCVLVAVDVFTKWVEVRPLVRHDANSVAEAFVNMCCSFGAPKLVRCDNGTEFCNAVVKALFDAFGVTVAHRAVRHPKSQGAAERFNQTLLMLIRKILDTSDDWQLDMDLLLFYYRARPHSSTGMSPMQAMHGWGPRGLVVDRPLQQFNIGSWVAELDCRSAAVHELLDNALTKTDFVAEPDSQYSAGDRVLLRQPPRSQKHSPPFKSGWVVCKHVGPSTVLIRHTASGAEKIVNVELVKLDVLPTDAPARNESVEEDEASQDDQHMLEFCTEPAPPMPAGEAGHAGHNLRDRSGMRCPSRFRS